MKDEEKTSSKTGIFNAVTVDEAVEENERKKEEASKYLPYFTLADKEVATVMFLQEEPLTFYQHTVFDPQKSQGSGGNRTLTCIREGCPLCKAGDRPKYMGAYKIVHLDAEDKDGNVGPMIKVLLKGTDNLQALTKKSKRYGLTKPGNLVEIERTGKGLNTKYTYEVVTGDTDNIDYGEDDKSLEDMFAPKVDVMKRLARTLSGKNSKRDDDDDDDDDDENYEDNKKPAPVEEKQSRAFQPRQRAQTNDDEATSTTKPNRVGKTPKF